MFSNKMWHTVGWLADIQFNSDKYLTKFQIKLIGAKLHTLKIFWKVFQILGISKSDKILAYFQVKTIDKKYYMFFIKIKTDQTTQNH